MPTSDLLNGMGESGGTAPAGLEDTPAGVEEFDRDALRAEVAKWQERVPRLASALRERTEELAAVRGELRAAKAGGAASPETDDARLRARDQLIAELQEKVAELGERHRASSSELHAAQLGLEAAREEARGWQEKWQQVTSSLDDSVADASRAAAELEQARRELAEQADAARAAHESELERVRKDVESLRVRNANLQETIELANKQIETLGEDMALLVEQANAGDASLAAANDEIARHEEAVEGFRQRIADLQRDAETAERALREATGARDTAQQAQQEQAQKAASLETRLREQESTANEAREALKALKQAFADQAAKLSAEHDEQVRRLEQRLAEEDERYASAMRAAEVEQNQLAGMLDDKDKVIGELKAEAEELEQTAVESHSRAEQHRRSLEDAIGKLEEAEQVNRSRGEQIQVLEKELERKRQAAAAAGAELQELQQRVASLERASRDAEQTARTVQAKAAEEAGHAAERIRVLNTCLEDTQNECLRLQGAQADQAAQLENLREEHERSSSSEQELRAQVAQMSESAQSARAEFDAEIERLNQCVGQAQEAQAQYENERRDLTESNRALEERNAKLEASLEERSALERELENERGERSAEQSETAAELARLRQELSETRDSLHAEVAREQTARKEQQNAVHALQTELHEAAAARTEEIAALQAQIREHESGAAADAAPGGVEHQDQVRELEQLLRERTEELDNLRWRQQQQEASAEAGADDNLVMILNQQLGDARAENKRLLEKLANFKSGSETVAQAYDLTSLKGVGDKLAEQLAELGITRLQQIAELDPAALEDTEHVLHAYRSRILRDDWIDQANQILAG